MKLTSDHQSMNYRIDQVSTVVKYMTIVCNKVREVLSRIYTGMILIFCVTGSAGGTKRKMKKQNECVLSTNYFNLLQDLLTYTLNVQL